MEKHISGCHGLEMVLSREHMTVKEEHEGDLCGGRIFLYLDYGGDMIFCMR